MAESHPFIGELKPPHLIDWMIEHPRSVDTLSRSIFVIGRAEHAQIPILAARVRSKLRSGHEFRERNSNAAPGQGSSLSGSWSPNLQSSQL